MITATILVMLGVFIIIFPSLFSYLVATALIAVGLSIAVRRLGPLHKTRLVGVFYNS